MQIHTTTPEYDSGRSRCARNISLQILLHKAEQVAVFLIHTSGFSCPVSYSTRFLLVEKKQRRFCFGAIRLCPDPQPAHHVTRQGTRPPLAPLACRSGTGESVDPGARPTMPQTQLPPSKPSQLITAPWPARPPPNTRACRTAPSSKNRGLCVTV